VGFPLAHAFEHAQGVEPMSGLARNEKLGCGLALIVFTLIVYWPAIHYGFINYDDDRYVTENPTQLLPDLEIVFLGVVPERPVADLQHFGSLRAHASGLLQCRLNVTFLCFSDDRFEIHALVGELR
jgi:hypothetical protein